MERGASLSNQDVGAESETPVNVGKFNREPGKQGELVAGATDAAVITEASGPIWPKCKRHFAPLVSAEDDSGDRGGDDRS